MMNRFTLLCALLLAGAARAVAAGPVPGAERDLRIAFLTDIHVTPGNHAEKVLRQAIDEINAERYDLVLVTGDLCNMGSDAELENVHALLSGLKHPTYTLPGNHETTWSESACTAFGRLWGHPGRFAFRRGDYYFVGFTAGPYMKMADGGVRQEDLLWVEKALGEAPEGCRIVALCHYPLDNSLTNRSEVTGLLNRYGVCLDLCGHGHLMRRYNFDGIPAVMGRALVIPAEHGVPTEGYNILRLEGDSVLLDEKPVGRSAYTVFRFRQGRSADNDALPCDAMPAPLDFESCEARLVVRDTASIYTGVALSGERLFYGNSLGYLCAYDLRKEHLAWCHRFDNGVYSTPLVEGNTVVAGSSDGALCAFDARKGRLRWRIATETPVIGQGVIGDGTLYMGLGSGRMAAIDLESGKTQWVFRFGDGQPQGRPVIEGDRLIFGAWDTYLYCLDRRTGELLWKWNNGTHNKLLSPGNIVPRVANRKVFIVAPDRYLTAINLDTGKELWRNHDYKYRETTGIDDSLTRFLAKTMDGEMVAVATTTDNFTLLWATDAGWGYDHNPCPIAVRDGVAYMADRQGDVAAVRVEDGRLLWRAKFANSAANDFTLSADGSLWVSFIEGRIYRIP